MTLRVLSLGAGVQSTALLLMILRGEFEDAPSCAIFADPGWESKHTYEHLENLTALANKQGFPIFTVGAGSIRQELLTHKAANGGKFWNGQMPVYLRNKNGSAGMVRRQCTKRYKVEPIEWKLRDILGIKKGKRVPIGAVEQWFGISADEKQRVRMSNRKCITNYYPLVFDRPATRRECKDWLVGHYPDMKVGRSACIGCPYKTDREWREMRDNRPDEWVDVCEFDVGLRDIGLYSAKGAWARNDVYLHRSLIPLSEVDLRTDEEHGQVNMFENECEGMCGV